MRLNRSYIQARFERIAAILAWNTDDCWTRGEDGSNHAVIGAVFMDFNAIYGGYQINRMANACGGQQTLLPHRMKASALDAWFSGVEFARTDR